jgi:hypothetical protein
MILEQKYNSSLVIAHIFSRCDVAMKHTTPPHLSLVYHGGRNATRGSRATRNASDGSVWCQSVNTDPIMTILRADTVLRDIGTVVSRPFAPPSRTRTACGAARPGPVSQRYAIRVCNALLCSMRTIYRSCFQVPLKLTRKWTGRSTAYDHHTSRLCRRCALETVDSLGSSLVEIRNKRRVQSGRWNGSSSRSNYRVGDFARHVRRRGFQA